VIFNAQAIVHLLYVAYHAKNVLLDVIFQMINFDDFDTIFDSNRFRKYNSEPNPGYSAREIKKKLEDLEIHKNNKK
jgi:predicted transcriptional regulator